MLSACSSLVSVIGNGGSRVVQFSHFSVKEFLTSDRLADSIGDISRFHITLEPSHVILAQACLAALFFLNRHTNGESKRKAHLVEYAARFWVEHAQFENVEFRIKDAVDQFFDTSQPHCWTWFQIYDMQDDMEKSLWSDTKLVWWMNSIAPLYYAALCEFHGLVERQIVKHPQHIHARSGRSGTLLNSSVSLGQTKLAQLLTAHGADINSQGEYGVTPLHIASANGRLDAIKWLLDRGADVTSCTLQGKTPLHQAALRGQLEAARILVEHKAEVDAQLYPNGHTPLRSALRGKFLDIVRPLLATVQMRMRATSAETLLCTRPRILRTLILFRYY